LAGGVFQNKLLLQLVRESLSKQGMGAYTHTASPCNDACVSLGQAVIAGLRG
jgi:hydrogenase maturation protein HypF